MTERDIEIALCVFREANDALVVFDPRDRRVVAVNPAALRLTGLEKKSALSLKIADLLGSGDPRLFDDFLEASDRTGFFHSREGYELARDGGPPIPVNVSLSRIHTSPDPLALVMIRDITARKKVEDELRRARDELESRVQERTAELLQAKEAAEAAIRIKDRFLAILSHELRTPLTPVLAVVSALLDDPSTLTTLRPTLEMICRCISLEARLIDDLLDLTQFNQGEFQLEFEPIDAHALIDQAVDLYRDQLRTAGVRLAVERSARASIVAGDPTRLLQVVGHLIQNAVKFSDEGGMVVVRTTNTEDGKLVLTIVDEGLGIEPEFVATIFDRFEQGSPTIRRRYGGLGVGLSISRSICEAHGGTLTAASAGLGQGSSFTLTLPGARVAPPADPGESTPKAPQPDLATGLKLLVVEDSQDLLRYLKIVLEMKGYKVTTAANLASARAALAESFDILISDIELPDGSGLELMSEFRGQLPGLAMSGFGSAEDIQLSLKAGFGAHLTKPLAIGTLEAAIGQVIAGFKGKSDGMMADGR